MPTAMRLLSTLALGFSLLACAPSYFVPVPESPGVAGEATLQVLAREAVSPDPERANTAILRLRASGPAGLNALPPAKAVPKARQARR